MNERLQKAMAMAQKLPPEGQEDLASAMLALMGADDRKPVRLTAEDWAAIDISIQQADRGEFASEDEIDAIWKKHA